MRWIKNIINQIRSKISYRRTPHNKDYLIWVKNIIGRIRLEIRYRKKLKELRKRDPFIYK
jgi:hypothetical protein